MSSVSRLVTSVDTTGGEADPRCIAVSARHEAELDDGRRVLLLDDRGWSVSGPPDLWASISVQDVVAMTRATVGPDEPPPGRTAADEDAAHWASLAQTLRRHGVRPDGEALAQLPHDVVLSARLRARLTAVRDGRSPPS